MSSFAYRYNDETGVITRSLQGVTQFLSYARFAGFALCAWSWADREEDAASIDERRAYGALTTIRRNG